MTGRSSCVALVLVGAALMAGCDTGDGKSLAPPPPTTAPPPTPPTTTAAFPEVTFLEGFGELALAPPSGVGEPRELGFAVSVCRWTPEGASGAAPVLTATGEGVTDGERFVVTVESTRTAQGDVVGRAHVSFTAGAVWRAGGPDDAPVVMDVTEQARGLLVQASVEVVEIGANDTRTPLGPATLDITCL